MCGLTAAIGKPGKEMQRVWEDLLCINILRGIDSTGVAAATLKNGVSYYKAVVWPWQLMRTKDYAEIVTDNQDKNHVLIGHCRAATRGSVSINNAHPFMHGNITMVHNGTLKSHINHKGRKTETDSESICIGVAERGIAAVWKELDGDATLVWYDANDKSLNAISNGKRPLAYCYNKGRTHMYLASQSDMLKFTLETAEVDIDDDSVYKADDDKHIKWRWDEKKGIVTVGVAKLEPRPFYVAPSARQRAKDAAAAFAGTNTVTVSSIHGPANDGRPHRGKPTTNGSNTGSTASSNVVPINKTSKYPSYPNANRRGFSKLGFLNTFKNCFLCNDPLHTEYHTAAIVDDTHAACQSCAETFGEKNMPLEAMKGS